MTQIRLFKTEFCPKCNKLKDYLEASQLPFTIMDMQSSEGMSELMFNQVFVREAPVLQIGDTFYTTASIFSRNEISDSMKMILGGL